MSYNEYMTTTLATLTIEGDSLDCWLPGDDQNSLLGLVTIAKHYDGHFNTEQLNGLTHEAAWDLLIKQLSEFHDTWSCELVFGNNYYGKATWAQFLDSGITEQGFIEHNGIKCWVEA
jgi:hypothetical protein